MVVIDTMWAVVMYLEGTCRTYEPEKRDYIERRLVKAYRPSM